MERLAYFSFIITGLAGTVHGMALPLLIDEFQLSLSAAGFLLFASSLGYLLASIAFPFFNKHMASGRILRLAFLIAALFHFLLPLIPFWFLILIAGFVASLGTGTVDVGFNTLISGLEPERAKIAVNWLHFSYGIGALIGPALLSRFLNIGFSWISFYFATGLLFLICFIFWEHYLKHTPPAKKGTEEVASPLLLFKEIHYWLLMSAIFIYVATEVALVGWIPTLLTSLGLPAANASLGISVIWFGIALGRALSTQIIKRIVPHRLLFILIGGSVIFMTGLVITSHVALVFSLLFCTGLFFSAIFPLLLLRSAFLFPEFTAASASGLVVAGSFGAMVGPAFLGIIGEHYSLQTGVFLLALFLLLSLGLLLVVPTEKKQSE